MTDREWESLCFLIEEAWPGSFDEPARLAWRTLLDGFTADEIAVGVRAMVARGGTFRPSAAEVAAEIRCDPSAPTFTEAFELIFGARGVLTARPAPGGSYESEAQMLRARDQAGLDRAYERHPLLGAFCQAYGVGRLRLVPVDSDEYRGVVRRDLAEAWERFVEANAHRDAAALAAGQRRELSHSPRRLDPAAALGLSAQREESS